MRESTLPLVNVEYQTFRQLAHLTFPIRFHHCFASIALPSGRACRLSLVHSHKAGSGG